MYYFTYTKLYEQECLPGPDLQGPRARVPVVPYPRPCLELLQDKSAIWQSRMPSTTTRYRPIPKLAGWPHLAQESLARGRICLCSISWSDPGSLRNLVSVCLINTRFDIISHPAFTGRCVIAISSIVVIPIIRVMGPIRKLPTL